MKRNLSVFPLFLLFIFSASSYAQDDSRPELHNAGALLHASPQIEDVETALAAATDALASTPSSAQFVIAHYLRLRLAALYLADNNTATAREHLRQINTASPAAIHASLLMAESYKQENNPELALRWFLRTAQHYPYRTATLEGLLQAANDARATNPRIALPIYNEIEKQGHYALAQLATLDNDDVPIDPNAVLFSSHLDTAVRRSLVQYNLRHTEHDLLQETASLKRAIRTIVQLRKQHAQLENELATLTAQLQQYQTQREETEQQLTDYETKVAELNAQIIPRDFSEPQLRIRQQVTQLNNYLERERTQLRFIQQTQQALPGMVQRVENDMRTLHQEAQQTLANSHGIITATLTQSLAAYRSDLLNLVAEARLQHSEMLATQERR